MVQIAGYADRWSLRAGDTVQVMVSCEGGETSFRADLVRLICGEVSPAGPGYKEEEIANPANPPTGCKFHPRCPFAIDRCIAEEPALESIGPGKEGEGRQVRCHRAHELDLIGIEAD